MLVVSDQFGDKLIEARDLLPSSLGRPQRTEPLTDRYCTLVDADLAAEDYERRHFCTDRKPEEQLL